MSIQHSINSRGEMLSAFDDRIRGTQSDLLKNSELSEGRNMLKTGVIESNIDISDGLEEEQVQQIIEIDEELYIVEWDQGEEDSQFLFFDTLDERYWIVYSLADSRSFSEAIDTIISGEGAGLDRLWLPTGQVEKIGDMGEYEGVKISFGATDVFPDEFIQDNFRFTDLNIDGSGPNSRHLYEILKGADEIDDFLALSRIQIRRERGDEFVRESVSNDGMFTTRGGSQIRLHVSTVNAIKDRYARLVSNIESNHVIGAEESSVGAVANGSPIGIRFSRPIHDIEEFLSHVVDATNPFRLFGHTRQVGEESFKVSGVDMHNGDNFAMEVSPSWIRLYLYGEACGNTALRIFTNLQQHYDPAARLILHDTEFDTGANVNKVGQTGNNV